MTNFALAHASGTEWISISDTCLADLGSLGRVKSTEQLGLVYLTDQLAGDVENILDHLRSETGIDAWVGSVGMGICATGQEYFDTPAMAVMIAELPPDSFHLMSTRTTPGILPLELANWAKAREARFGIVHADPRNSEILEIITDLADGLDSFLVGGLTSSRGELAQISGEVTSDGVSGVLFAGDVPVSTALSQSCMPIAERHQITECEDNVLIQLDGRPALEVFKEDIGELLARDMQRVAGYIFAALPIANSDTGDYLVRNLAGIDVERQLLAIGELVEPGQTVQFCRRDAQAAEADLERMLGDLRKRSPAPKGGVYFSCLARGPNMFGDASQEMKIIERELGNVPLVGFFCNGEISHNRLYTYTGVLTLFN